MADKIYVPKSSAKVAKSKYGEIMKLSFHVDSLLAFIKENVNNRGWINIDVLPRKETGQYGQTHYMVLNDWTPDGNGSASPRQQQPKQQEQEQPVESNLPTDTSGDDSIPF